VVDDKTKQQTEWYYNLIIEYNLLSANKLVKINAKNSKDFFII